MAGVVNYVTRKNFEGLELNADYRYIEDSDGDYNADMLWGKDFGDAGNLLVSFSYQHRSALQHDRSRLVAVQLPGESASWQSLTSPISNPGSVVFQRAVPGLGQVSYTRGPRQRVSCR